MQNAGQSKTSTHDVQEKKKNPVVDMDACVVY